jgi:DNA-binding MarR family transcriptional regulator
MAASASNPRRSRGVSGSPAARSRPPAVAGPGRDAHGEALLHDRTRLGIVSALASADTLTFVELKRLLDITDGNLSVHARRLEDAGYVTCHKRFADRRPRSEYRLTATGRRALQRYLEHMEALIAATRRSLRR